MEYFALQRPNILAPHYGSLDKYKKKMDKSIHVFEKVTWTLNLEKKAKTDEPSHAHEKVDLPLKFAQLLLLQSQQPKFGEYIF